LCSTVSVNIPNSYYCTKHNGDDAHWKLIVSQLVRNFPVVYEARSSFALLTRAHHLFLYWATWIQPTFSHLISLRRVALLPFLLYYRSTNSTIKIAKLNTLSYNLTRGCSHSFTFPSTTRWTAQHSTVFLTRYFSMFPSWPVYDGVSEGAANPKTLRWCLCKTPEC